MLITKDLVKLDTTLFKNLANRIITCVIGGRDNKGKTINYYNVNKRKDTENTIK